MTKSLQIVLLAFGAGLLLCLLAYPFGYDQAVFSVAGELAIKHGAVTYRDFLDTKPPLIFALYGVAIFLFGHHEWAPRLFDILFQALTLFYLYRVLLRATSDKALAFASVLLYIIYYSTSGFWMTGQAETFALLPSVWILSLAEEIRAGRRPLLNGALIGLAATVLFFLKFTLVAVPAAAGIYLLLTPETKLNRFKLRFVVGSTMAFVLSMAVSIGYLAWVGSLQRALETLTWLGGYSAIEPLLTMKTIGESFFKEFPLDALGVLLPTTTILAVLGIYTMRRREGKRASILYHLLLQLGFGLLTVLYERKFFPYHFSRIFWAFVPFVFIGLRTTFVLLREYVTSIRRLAVFERLLRFAIGSVLILIALFYSPAIRIFTNPLYWGQLRMRGGDAARAADAKFGGLYSADQVEAARELKATLRPNESVFLWGNNVGLYFRLDVPPTTLCLTNTPFVTSWTPQAWKDTLLGQLRVSQPRFIVCETQDARPYITGDTLDSREHLQQWTALAEFVQSNYHDWKTIGHFVIFEHL